MAWKPPKHPNGVSSSGGVHKTPTNSSSSSKPTIGSSSSSSASSNKGSSSSSNKGSSGGSSIVQVQANGKAPTGLKAGTIVQTAGGNFKITSVNSDGSYKSEKVRTPTIGSVSTNRNYNSGGSSNSRPTTVKVGSDGKAPKGLSVGSIVQTGGGDFKVTGYNKDGSYQSQKLTPNHVARPQSIPKTVRVGSDGKAPKGLSVGTVVQTAGGQFKITGVNGDGSYQSQKISNANNTTQVSSNTKSNVTYQHNGQTKNGYVVNGITYDAATNKPVGVGAIVTLGNQQYLKTVDGGIDVNKAHTSAIQRENKNGALEKVGTAVIINGKAYNRETGDRVSIGDVVTSANGTRWQMTNNGGVKYNVSEFQGLKETPITDEEYLQKNIDTLMGWVSETPSLQDTLTWEQAMARAQSQSDPMYNAAINDMMDAMDKTALKTGFYGQLPTEALKRNTAGNLEVQKLQAIQELATKLFGQSEDSAYKALDAATTEQQNKINALLNMLGIYQSERGYRDSREDNDYNKKLQEASITGYYNGKPTLDFLEHQRLNSKSK